ncbi:MAG: response regulator [Planctomycetaceae bacterium]|nr:response regulator [Planctomycetaceae bacterium]
MDLNIKHPNVLVVEDDPSYYRLLQMYIERAGGESEVCNDGNLALQKVLSNSYDLVLVDMHLPGMDGIMLSVLLREKGYSKPLIAITALQVENMEEYALKAGLDEYLEKPLTAEKIEGLLRKYCTFEVL